MPGRQPQASSIISAARNSPPEAELPSHFQCCRWLPCRHDVDVAARSQAAPLCLPLIRPGRVRQVADVFSQRFYETKGVITVAPIPLLAGMLFLVFDEILEQTDAGVAI